MHCEPYVCKQHARHQSPSQFNKNRMVKRLLYTCTVVFCHVNAIVTDVNRRLSLRTFFYPYFSRWCVVAGRLKFTMMKPQSSGTTTAMSIEAFGIRPPVVHSDSFHQLSELQGHGGTRHPCHKGRKQCNCHQWGLEAVLKDVKISCKDLG